MRSYGGGDVECRIVPEEFPMSATEPLSHDDLDALLVRLRLGVDASELHGSLCGYLAGGAAPHGGNLLAALQLDGEEVAPSPADHNAVRPSR